MFKLFLTELRYKISTLLVPGILLFILFLLPVLLPAYLAASEGRVTFFEALIRILEGSWWGTFSVFILSFLAYFWVVLVVTEESRENRLPLYRSLPISIYQLGLVRIIPTLLVGFLVIFFALDFSNFAFGSVLTSFAASSLTFFLVEFFPSFATFFGLFPIFILPLLRLPEIDRYVQVIYANPFPNGLIVMAISMLLLGISYWMFVRRSSFAR